MKKAQIIGNLGRDPETRYTPSGDAVCSLSVAVTERKKGESVTTWFKVTVWRKQAENVAKYLGKGSKVFVEGVLSLEEWRDRDGNTRSTLAIDARDVVFLSAKSEHAEAPPPNDDDDTPF